ncbi:MAG: protein-(glutamine-N5) methyltransferase, release factor-specific [Gemmatimonadetes bacterium 21-71-4]|nr:MAG: protein-(glutamine-N5) methyltransferase, release factor-specific [Gemmatimonadetes bacterium 21-71-4]
MGDTVASAIERARLVLDAGGVARARVEAAELYAALVGRAASASWLEREEPLAAPLAVRLAEAAHRRAEGWPQAYAAGRANFRGWWLAVDRRVLIPRPETEGLVDLVLAWLRSEGAERPLVADAGTGSGAIAIALVRESFARAVATDYSAGALQVARANAAEHRVAERVELERGHLLAPLRGASVDVVVSNPPYVATGEWERLEPGVKDYEPREALDGGPDGLAPTRELVAQAWVALRAGGLLALELDSRRAGESAELAVAAGFTSCVVVEDLSGRPRYLRARRPADGRH